MTPDIKYLLEPVVQNKLPNDGPIHFVVVGAGGTGGYFIPQLVRQMAIINKNRQVKHTLTVYDKDDIEEKNLTRQNFIQADIGKNKAEVMASRYGRSFAQEVGYVPEYIKDPIVFGKEIISRLYPDNNRQHVVLVDCTDNNKTRLIMKEAADMMQGSIGHGTVVLLSSGNEESAGQIICSFKPRMKNNKKIIYSDIPGLSIEYDSLSTPDFFDVFPNFDLEKLPDELSCAEAAVSSPQNIFTNMSAANILFGYANRLLNNQGISELMIFFDTSSFTQKVYRHKYTDMKDMLNFSKNNAAFKDYLGNHKDAGIETTGELQRPMTWKQALEQTQKEKEEKEKEVESLVQSVLAK